MEFILKFISKILIHIISFVDSFEHSDDKLIKTFKLEGIKVMSETGWVTCTHIHITKPFNIYKIVTENGYMLECADEHLVFTPQMQTIWVKDLIIGQEILTKDGASKVISITNVNNEVCMCDMTVDSETHSYYTNGILSHNTTTSALFLLHYVLFNFDKNALVLGNKRATAVEILDKIKKIFLELPFYLKPGILKWNESEIVFDNGCRIIAEATTINSGISFTFHCVLADEFAHIHPNILDKFYNNLFPTITAGKARFIISSTQNGFNLFQRLYTAAIAHENDYAPFCVDWWQVPEWNPDTHQWEKRDEAWHQRQIANYGSEEAFNRQFGTMFEISGNSLVNPKIIAVRNHRAVLFENKDLPGVAGGYENFYWKPDYEPAEQLKHDTFMITIDISEGLSQDYTVFMFNRIVPQADNPKQPYYVECVGYFHNNTLEVRACARALCDLCRLYLTPYHYYISMENNLYGELFYRYVRDNIDENIELLQRLQQLDKEYQMTSFDESMFLRTQSESSKRYIVGIRMTIKSKLLCCKQFKDMYEADTIRNDSIVFINELQNFCDVKGNNTYKASYGHDDLVMAQAQLALTLETPQFKELLMYANATESILDENAAGNYNIYNF